MLRRLGSVISVAALLFGFVSAPHTHVHQSAGSVGGAHDDHHSGPLALLHAHVTPHPDSQGPEHLPPEGEPDGGQTVWSVGGFAFQPSSATQPVPALPVLAVVLTSPAGLRTRVNVIHSRAHAPPSIAGSPLRGPPIHPTVVS